MKQNKCEFYKYQNSNKIYPLFSISTVARNIHPNYSSWSNNYDIALFFLSEPAKLNKFIQTIGFPTYDECVIDDKKCFISGVRGVSANSSDRFWVTDTFLTHKECLIY